MFRFFELCICLLFGCSWSSVRNSDLANSNYVYDTSIAYGSIKFGDNRFTYNYTAGMLQNSCAGT